MYRSSRVTLFKVLVFVCGFTAAAAVSAASQEERQLVADPLLDHWAQEAGLADMLNGMIESSRTTAPTLVPTKKPTTSPTDSPTNHPATASPTLSPSKFPSQSPTTNPTEQPSISFHPSSQPSSRPTSLPSIAPSTSVVPTAAPSREPSFVPSRVPSTSQGPTTRPSFSPSDFPSVNPSDVLSSRPSDVPSSQPSAVPSSKPSSAQSETPSCAPSLIPTKTPSTSPSQIPTEIKILESSVIINQFVRKNSTTPMIVVGACSFVLMASISMFLYRKGSRHNSIGTPPVMEVSILSIPTGGDPKTDGCCAISPCSIEAGLGPQHGTFDTNYSESESIALDEDTLDYNYAEPQERRFETAGRTNDVPNSVSIIKHTQQSDADKHINLSNIGSPLEQSRLRMPRSIYVPKMFKPAKKESNQHMITWNQIRDEGRSPASSGYSPASVPSPVLPPSFAKGLTSMLSPRKQGPSREQQAARKEKRNVVQKSPSKDTAVKRVAKEEARESNVDICVGLNDATSKGGGEHKTLCSKSSGSKSSDSSLDWGIDVSKVQPSKASFEANMAELQNLLVSIKTLGSHEAPIAEDVAMTYTEDSSEATKAEQNSLKSDAPNMNIAPVSSASNDSTQSESSSARSFHPCNHVALTSGVNAGCGAVKPGLTYERELLNSERESEETINFANIFNDPCNDIYECRQIPSGPLGIVVDTTLLGPRVRSLNPLSPIFGRVSPGDVIVGVDEVITVGMEAGAFWQIVSRKANQQERILAVLRI